MKRKIVWMVLSCLTVLSLLLASCAPAAPEKETVVTEEKVVTEKKEVVKEEVTKEEAVPVVEKPEYGGTAVIALSRDNYGFDQLYLSANWHISHTIVYEELLMGDWSRGPAGTNESDFTNTGFAPEGFYRDTGALAESWEIPDDQTLIFKIRKGVYWQNKPPVNGREMTASDIVWYIKYYYINSATSKKAYNVLGAPGGNKVTDAYVDPNDKWTVVVKVEDLAPLFIEDIADKFWFYAPEVIETYGDAKDWRHSLGTGPFMLTDYVAGSSLTFVRNPNYWMKDPVGPGKGNQLPYLDGVQALVIPDESTILAALRTGRVDQIGAGGTGTISGSDAFPWEDVESLLKTNPEIKTKEVLSTSQGFSVRLTSTDPRAAPLMNRRVRQALSLAIDQEAIARDYYKGKAIIKAALLYPTSPYYSSDDENVEILKRVHGFTPEEAQLAKRLFEYHPDEAKKILAEEGYPNGFKTTITLTAPDVDLFSIVKGYLAEINVDLELDVREYGVYQSIMKSHTFPALKAGAGAAAGWPERWFFHRPGSPINDNEFDDPVINEAIARTDAAYSDYEARSKVIKEAEPYLIWLAWNVFLPGPHRYNVWQPWLKNYHGESALGYRSHFNWLFFSWYDQDLKQEITGKR